MYLFCVKYYRKYLTYISGWCVSCIPIETTCLCKIKNDDVMKTKANVEENKRYGNMGKQRTETGGQIIINESSRGKVP